MPLQKTQYLSDCLFLIVLNYFQLLFVLIILEVENLFEVNSFDPFSSFTSSSSPSRVGVGGTSVEFSLSIGYFKSVDSSLSANFTFLSHAL